ncbi:TlpA disulfide reductase family protein [Chitinophagaceae bacterium MMS25-I14]
MHKYIACLLSAFLLIAICTSAQKTLPVTAHSLMNRAAEKDTTYIINFWATWCGPCVKELPAFDTLQRQYAGKPVKVLLVSFDFKEDYQKKINAFVARKHPLPEILWFSETNADEFIPVIDNRWSGALPATLVVHGADRAFFEGTITVAEVSAAANKFIP